MKMIGLFSFILSAVGLTACQPQPVNQLAQQQHFICKSLIDGFLKTQQLAYYELNSLKPTLEKSAESRFYSYRASRDHNIKINMPIQQNLEFECRQNSAQHFEIQLSNPHQYSQQPLLSLNLPPQQALKDLTAFSVEQQ